MCVLGNEGSGAGEKGMGMPWRDFCVKLRTFTLSSRGPGKGRCRYVTLMGWILKKDEARMKAETREEALQVAKA